MKNFLSIYFASTSIPSSQVIKKSHNCVSECRCPEEADEVAEDGRGSNKTSRGACRLPLSRLLSHKQHEVFFWFYTLMGFSLNIGSWELEGMWHGSQTFLDVRHNNNMFRYPKYDWLLWCDRRKKCTAGSNVIRDSGETIGYDSCVRRYEPTIALQK